MKAIKRPMELGLNWIDTAAAYGLGHSGELVASVLDGVPEAERSYVFSEYSLLWDEHGKLCNSLKKECEDSLRRLKVHAIDLYQTPPRLRRSRHFSGGISNRSEEL